MIPLAFLAPAMGFARSWWKAGVGIVIGCALALPVGQCQGRQAARVEADLAAADAREVAAARNAAAREKAASERLTDVTATRKAEQDLSHADDAIPDSRPSPKRGAYLCARLREQESRGGPAAPADCRPGR